MKKILNFWKGNCLPFSIQSRRVMRITFILIFATVFSLQASDIYSQNARISIKEKSSSVRDVLKAIEDKSEFYFAYNNELVDVERQVDVKVEDEKISSVLDQIFQGTDISYTILDRQIILSSAEAMDGLNKEVQDKYTVTGKIVDINGQSLPGVSIVVKGSMLGTITDIDGNFVFKDVLKNGTLVFSFIGMKTKEIVLAGESKLDVILVEEAFGLSEVVAIGYGSAKKSDLSSSIATVTGLDKINSRAITSPSDFLQGNTAGVTVIQQGGDPTKTAKVVIRGVGSVNDESPLWVVDGMPYYGGALNPNDIESMVILKDAASASIYGAQAASGVIVITTKSGKSGKPKISFDFFTGVQQAMNKPTPLNAEQQSWAYNTATDNVGASRLPAHDAVQNPFGAVTRTNWIDAIFRKAYVKNANFSISGGGEKVRYMSSFNYQDKDGLLIGTNSKRFAFRMKTEYDITDNIKIGENIFLARTEAVGANTSSSYSGAIINAMYMPSSAPVYDAEGNYHGVAPAESKFAGAYGDVFNPVAMLNRPTVTNPITNLNANVYLDYKIIQGLKFRSSFSVDLRDDDYKKFTPKIPESGRRTDMNYLDQSWSNRNKWIWDNQINYEKSYGKHNLNLTAVYSAQHTDYEYNDVNAQDFSREEDWYQYLKNAGEIIEWDSDVYEDALTSAIGRFRYNFDNRYFFSASIRNDRSSRLAKENNDDMFSSFSAAWRLSEEGFMKDIDWITSLKLRGSWGQIGNIQSVNYYAYNVPMSSHRPYLGESPSYLPGYYVAQQSNRNLKWEKSETYDFGIDATLFNGRLDLVADYFEKTTKDMILTNAANPHTGVGDGPTSNVGSVKNWGYEMSVNYRNNDKKLKYSIGANFSTIKNELLDLDGYTSDYIYHDDNVRSSLFPYRSEAGQPLYSYHLVQCEGLFKTQAEIDAHQSNGNLIQPNAKPGDLKFKDANNDGKISDDDRVFHGNAFPTFTYAINLNLEYKGFDLSCILQGVEGGKVFNAYKYSTYNMSEQTYNRDNRILGAWSVDNPNSNIPRLQTTDDNRNFATNSTWYLEDASYLRMKNITLGYSFPHKIIDKVVKGSSLRIYFTAENLFTITDYSGMDPEVGGIGLDVGSYPVARTISTGLSFAF
ncbi:TonB-dependent receptor [Labilibaculum antarcticum]|uniref:SusC/RagA family TonB-linked outer membrane protein n=1 Tax=Labilibaculum antarcticum TaxID=1717717 RepID=A0A1Y1CI33_9BACT|nr:TonB-dependent receptor [Labilibaculum antarcticum]BAX79985.1 SusC/RagA family TonB-linked outer membrane protein [Labilibaculum antarcticum]